MTRPSLGKHYFDALYKSDADPWRFQTSEYEAEKYAATLAALPLERYSSCLEVGCSIGVLTRMLAARCDHVLGLDVAEAAIATATTRCADLPHVQCQVASFPDARLHDDFDLIVLSEVLYYFGGADITAVAKTVRDLARPQSDIVCVHWLGPTPDYPMTGDEAVFQFEKAIGAADIVYRDRQPNYRLDVLRLSPDS